MVVPKLKKLPLNFPPYDAKLCEGKKAFGMNFKLYYSNGDKWKADDEYGFNYHDIDFETPDPRWYDRNNMRRREIEENKRKLRDELDKVNSRLVNAKLYENDTIVKDIFDETVELFLKEVIYNKLQSLRIYSNEFSELNDYQIRLKLFTNYYNPNVSFSHPYSDENLKSLDDILKIKFSYFKRCFAKHDKNNCHQQANLMMDQIVNKIIKKIRDLEKIARQEVQNPNPRRSLPNLEDNDDDDIVEVKVKSGGELLEERYSKAKALGQVIEIDDSPPRKTSPKKSSPPKQSPPRANYATKGSPRKSPPGSGKKSPRKKVTFGKAQVVNIARRSRFIQSPNKYKERLDEEFLGDDEDMIESPTT